ncbi:MAG: TolC family protein [Verrucomicrobiae bacterium]|nr:TolC family protein [Verrucomicrobiae bacterium]
MIAKQPCWVAHLTLLTAFSLAWDSGIAGEPAVADSLTLSQCVERALQKSPALESNYRQYLAATHGEPQATALPEPQVSWTHYLEAVQTRTGPQENLFMISQTLPWFGKLRLKGEAANHEAEAARLHHEDARLALIREVSLSWLEYAYLAKETAITTESRGLLAQLVPVTEEQVRGGAPLTQQLTLELALGRLDGQLDDLKGRRSEASARLRAAMGESPEIEGTPLPWPILSDESATFEGDLENLAAHLRQHHPRLAALEQGVASAEAKARLAEKNAIPDPTIGANLHDIGDGGDTAAGISIGFRIPLAFKKYRAERAEAREREKAAVAEKENAELHLLAELEGAWERFQANARTVKRYRDELLPAADRIIDVSETSYRAGSASIRDVIDDQRDALDIRKAYWRAIADLHGAAIRVGTLAGDPEPLPQP